MKKYLEIERSIIKKYRKEIWSKFIKAIKEYKLIEENDKIAVCISGGKDSMLLAKCMQELLRHGKINFSLTFILMNPGYPKDKLNLILKNAKLLNIPIKVFKTNIFAVVEKYGGKNPCYLCARMRRGYLYDYAQKLGCNKIALAHHLNDVIETIMMNILYNGRFETMMPKLKSKHFKGMELIRPFYYVRENDIKNWANYHKINFLDCECKISLIKIENKRNEMKDLIKQLMLNNENTEINILRASQNVNLNTVIKYYQDGKEFNFLDKY